jgi:hypothetical protein
MTAAGEVCPKSGPFTTDSGLAFTDRKTTPASPAPIPSTTPPTTEKADRVPALVTITVGDTVANFQPVAGWDRLATAAHTPLTINREGLVSNDFDADSDELT